MEDIQQAYSSRKDERTSPDLAKPSIPSGTSKLAQLAKLRSKKVESSNSTETAPKAPERAGGKLAALAKARAAEKLARESSTSDSSSVPQSVAILDKLRTREVKDEAPGAKSSKLAGLLAKRTGLSKISSNRLNKETQEPAKPVAMEDEEEKEVEPKIPTQVSKPVPVLTSNVAYDDSILLKHPATSVSLLSKKRSNSIDNNRSKRRRHDHLLFHPLTNVELNVEKISKAVENFSTPSPDDKIVNAQKAAFEDKLSNLKIEEPKKNVIKTTKPAKKLDILHEISTSKTYSKPHKSFVVIGHVDAGKSTLMGRLLLDFGIVDIKTVNKLVKEAEKAGKGSFALAWIMDQTAEERSHGVTVDICATDFETEKTRFTAIDAPGHKDFVPQMIGGVSQADFALLVVDSITGEFEAGFAMDGQTKEHTVLAKNLGIEKVCVAINKMDKENWDELRFNSIKTQLGEFLTSDEVGFTSDQIDFIPISGLTGVNVIKRDAAVEALSWYKGPTLGEYLENVQLSTGISADSVSQLLAEDFFVSVHDVYKDKGELKVSGKITSGVIQVGETIVSSPSEITLQVHALKVASKTVDFAVRGDLVQLSFKSNQIENEAVDAIKIGDLISKVGSPAQAVKKLTISIHLFNMSKPLLVGSPFVLFRNNCQVPARISKLVEVTSGGKKKKKLLHLVSKQTAIVEVEVEGNALPLTKYSDNKILGRVVIRREGITIGAGTVVDF